MNSVERVGELARELGAKKVLLVTDPGIVAAGHAGRVERLLTAAGVKVALFDKVAGKPDHARRGRMPCGGEVGGH